MRGLVAYALVVTAAGVLASPVGPSPSPPRVELGSEFPLEPRVETEAPQPASAAQVESALPAEAAAADSQAVWLLLSVAVVAAAAGVLLVRSRAAAREAARGKAPAPARPARHSTPELVGAGRAAGVVAEPPAPAADAFLDERPLVDVLSASARLAERPEEAADPQEEPIVQAGEIECWRGYVKSQFFVAAHPPLEAPIASGLFRSRGHPVPAQSDAAARAHREVVTALVAAGWEPAGRGEHWFSERFLRVTVPNA